MTEPTTYRRVNLDELGEILHLCRGQQSDYGALESLAHAGAETVHHLSCI